MRVVLTDAAKADLRAIARWIATDNPFRAKTLAAELRESCHGLSTRPRRFPVARRTSRGEVRKRVHGSYLIFYRISNARVEISRIVHGSRDWVSLLGEGE